MSNKYCVIMAGGIGSRFWPLSRKSKPKQFLDILSREKSMIRATFERYMKIIPKENFLVMTNVNYREFVKEHLPEIEDYQILCEPIKRNTAPAIAYAAYHINTIAPDAVMVVAPSDHHIVDENQFAKVVNNCLSLAEEDDILMTIGVNPTRPESGYGYIQMGDSCTEGVYKVKTFTEKPDADMARVLIDSGEFLWNSGIFIWSCESILKAFQIHAPLISEQFDSMLEVFHTSQEQSVVDKIFTQCENISIDYAIMEKAKNVYVHNADFGWADIGTWGSLYDFMEKDKRANAKDNDNISLFNTSNTIIKSSPNKQVVIDGLDGYIVIDSADGLLICPMSNEQKIRTYISEVKE